MSIPSMIISPPRGSTNLKNTCRRVDLPLPVRPTTPIFSPPWMLKSYSFQNRRRIWPISSPAHRNSSVLEPFMNNPTVERLVSCWTRKRSYLHNSMLPLLGQFGRERAFIIFHGAADEMFVAYLILSTETIRFSKKQPMYMVQKQNTIERQGVGKQCSIIEMTTGLQRQKDFNFLGTE